MDPESREARKRLIRSDRATRKRPIQKPGFPWPPNAPRGPQESHFKQFEVLGHQTPPGGPQEARFKHFGPLAAKRPRKPQEAPGKPQEPKEPQEPRDQEPREAPGAQGAPGGSRDPQEAAQGRPRRPQDPQSAQSIQKARVLRCFGRAPSPRSHEIQTFHTTAQISMRFAMNSRTFPTTPQRNAHFRPHFNPKCIPF